MDTTSVTSEPSYTTIYFYGDECVLWVRVVSIVYVCVQGGPGASIAGEHHSHSRLIPCWIIVADSERRSLDDSTDHTRGQH